MGPDIFSTDNHANRPQGETAPSGSSDSKSLPSALDSFSDRLEEMSPYAAAWYVALVWPFEIVLRRSRLAAVLIVVGMALSQMALLAISEASANQITLFTCHTPNGQVVGHAGWIITRSSDTNMTASDTCGEGGVGSLHLEMGANGAGYGNGAGINWIFQAPSWATIASYTIKVADSYAYVWTGAGEGQAAIWASDESDPVYDYRNLSSGTREASTIQRTPSDAVTGLSVNASCDGEIGRCPAGAAISRLDIPSATLLLDDSTVPNVTNLAGSLVSGGDLRGSTEASFLASDEGPGVYSAWLIIDGKEKPRALLDSNNGWCTNLEQTSNGTRSFSHPEPCAEKASGSVTLDTTALTDGQHSVQLKVDDASGNTTTVYNATITTNNAPSVTARPGVSGVASVGSTLTGTNGTFSAPSGAGPLSGVTGQWLRCSDQAATQCSSIAQATGLSYQPQPADVGYYLVYSNTVSDNDGATTSDSQPTTLVSGSPGSSSCVGGECLHGGTGGVGGSGGAGGSGSSSGSGSGVTVDVLTQGNNTLLGSPAKWSVTLKASPGRVRKGITLKLAGNVSTSPRPAAGKLIYVRARTVRRRGHHRVYGKWTTFVDLYTKADGSWHTSYKFRLGGRHIYQMQAVAPSEGGFQNPTGNSPAITIIER
jgi:hypothetical protein